MLRREAGEEWPGKASLGRLIHEQEVGWRERQHKQLRAETLWQLPPDLCEKQQEAQVQE